MSVVHEPVRARTCALWVDPKVHGAEVARFRSKVVAGPGDRDCSIWIGSIGGDGYGRFYITRGGVGLCVRSNRYALALESGGRLGANVFALHECDNPVCVKVNPVGCGVQHVVAGDQHDNMRRMARTGRGGGRSVIRGAGRGHDSRRALSVALREAVRHGEWDAEAVYEARSGSGLKLF